ncbi:hypothetical protein AAVH_07234 [Aphelenchoides avenae]|nr:hypothetical protein AAVH_07234 [Aphelenchus avenae]
MALTLRRTPRSCLIFAFFSSILAYSAACECFWRRNIDVEETLLSCINVGSVERNCSNELAFWTGCKEGERKVLPCSMQWMSHVRVTDERSLVGDGAWLTHNVEHVQVFMAKQKLGNAIHFHSIDAACGLQFNVGEEYLLTGNFMHDGRAFINVCDLAHLPWNSYAQKFVNRLRASKGAVAGPCDRPACSGEHESFVEAVWRPLKSFAFAVILW